MLADHAEGRVEVEDTARYRIGKDIGQAPENLVVQERSIMTSGAQRNR